MAAARSLESSLAAAGSTAGPGHRLARLLEEATTEEAARHELLQYLDELTKHFSASAYTSHVPMAASSVWPLQNSLTRSLEAAGCEQAIMLGGRLGRLLQEGPIDQQSRRELLHHLDQLAKHFGSGRS